MKPPQPGSVGVRCEVQPTIAKREVSEERCCSVLEAALAVMDLDASAASMAVDGIKSAAKAQSGLRKKFLELSMLVHPDKNASPQAKEV